MPQPAINFDHYMVIAIFQGNGWNSRGLEAVSISEEDERVVFRYDDKSYQTWSSGDDSQGDKVTVYGFFVLPLLEKSIVIEENVQSSLDSRKLPIWEERVVLSKTVEKESGAK